MLEQLRIVLEAEAQAIESAVYQALSAERYTPDLGGSLTTQSMTEEIINHLALPVPVG